MMMMIYIYCTVDGVTFFYYFIKLDVNVYPCMYSIYFGIVTYVVFSTTSVSLWKEKEPPVSVERRGHRQVPPVPRSVNETKFEQSEHPQSRGEV